MRRALGTTQVGRSAVARRAKPGHAAAAVVVAGALALLVLAGACGGASSSDPFLGTWSAQPDSATEAIIGKSAGEYRVTMLQGTWGHAERHGDQLHCWAGDTPQTGMEIYLTYQPSSGQLLLTDPAGPGLHISLRRVSQGTAVPSPWPPSPASAAATP